MEIKNTGFYSKKTGDLCDGCKRCVKGEKLVLFITGVCPRHCDFCPISDEKYGKDVVFANEKKVAKKKLFSDMMPEIIEEARLCDATGAGITGGDPLASLDRTIEAIKTLKSEFLENNTKNGTRGKKTKKFHIHLYTSLDLVTNETLRKLYMAGLDEIRFHFDLNSKKIWERFDLALKYNWKIGVELPLIPGKEKITKDIVDYISGKAHFINLNELEVADNKTSKLLENGFTTKDETSYAVKGSYEMGLEILDYISVRDKKINAHLCTAKLKDKVQLANRIKKRASNVAKPYDIIDEEGLLVRGVIYPKGLEPGFGYNKKSKSMMNEKTIKSIERSIKNLKKDFKIPDGLIEADSKKPRILTSIEVIAKLSKKIKNKCAAVTEYPTDDGFEVDINFLN